MTKELDDLECVKMHGLSHKVAHILGTNSLVRCMALNGAWVIDGLKKGLESEVVPEVREHIKNAVKVL